jgi:hypothetical protein
LAAHKKLQKLKIESKSLINLYSLSESHCLLNLSHFPLQLPGHFTYNQMVMKQYHVMFCEYSSIYLLTHWHYVLFYYNCNKCISTLAFLLMQNLRWPACDILIYSSGNQKITDATFKQIGKMCPDLRHLYMVDCQSITDASLKALTTCKNLTIINLADCVRSVTHCTLSCTLIDVLV